MHTDAQSPVDPVDVKTVRRFNRFYTRQAGVLEPYLGSNLSLTEVRVLYELAHREGLTATDLSRELALDAGYLSRLLKRFDHQQWLQRKPNPRDARQNLLGLTEAGHAAFAPLQQKSRDQAAILLAPLSPVQRVELTEAMTRIEHLLAPAAPSPRTRTVLLRDPGPGDLGWVVQQHGEIYAREYGWNTEFEGLVAGIVADYVRKFQPAWERGWIAELDGKRVGSVFLVRKSATIAQLRMLLITPAARGLGLGARLTDECIAFARRKGYRKMVLWTNDCLDAARAIYAKRGFRLVKSAPYEGFGKKLVGETWELRL
jgi:DNA-binding MarR family transcriptional regulator/GNAT superfamily N-acetyltransferase